MAPPPPPALAPTVLPDRGSRVGESESQSGRPSEAANEPRGEAPAVAAARRPRPAALRADAEARTVRPDREAATYPDLEISDVMRGPRRSDQCGRVGGAK